MSSTVEVDLRNVSKPADRLDTICSANESSSENVESNNITRLSASDLPVVGEGPSDLLSQICTSNVLVANLTASATSSHHGGKVTHRIQRFANIKENIEHSSAGETGNTKARIFPAGSSTSHIQNEDRSEVSSKESSSGEIESNMNQVTATRRCGDKRSGDIALLRHPGDDLSKERRSVGESKTKRIAFTAQEEEWCERSWSDI